MNDSEEFNLEEMLAKLAADKEQTLANMDMLAQTTGKLYKALRRYGVPRRLASELVHDWWSAVVGSSVIETMMDHGDSD